MIVGDLNAYSLKTGVDVASAIIADKIIHGTIIYELM